MSVKFREHPETDPLAKKWSLRVSAARRHWDSFHRRIRHNRQLVSGLDWNRDPGQTGFYLHRANLIHSTIMGILPNIYAKNPEISVKPLHASRDLKLLCKTIETVTNRYLDDAQLKMRAKATVRAALTCSFGVLKVMYQQRIETDPLIHARIADSQDNRMRVAGLAMELEDDGNQNDKGKKEEIRETMAALQERAEVGRTEGLVIDRVLTENLLVDPSIAEFWDYEQADWMVQIVPMKKAVAEGLYGYKLDKATIYKHRDMRSSSTGSGRLFSGGKQTNDDDSQICILEIWDKQSQRVYTMAEGCEFWLRDPYSPPKVGERWYPFFLLPFQTVDGHFVGPSIVDLTERLQDEHNSARDRYNEHRDLIKPGYIASAELNEKTLKRFTDSELGEITLIDAEGQPIQQAIMPKSYPPIDPAVYDTSPVRLDWEMVTGLQDASRSSVVKPKTATEANILQQSLSGRVSEFRDQVEDFLQQIAQYTAEILIQELQPEQVEKIMGPHKKGKLDDVVNPATGQPVTGIVELSYDWPQLSKDEVFELVQLKIRAGTTGVPDDLDRQESWTKLLPVIQPLISQIMQFQLQGINPAALISLLKETVMRFDDKLDLEAFVPQLEAKPETSGAKPDTPEIRKALASEGQALSGSPQGNNLPPASGDALLAGSSGSDDVFQGEKGMNEAQADMPGSQAEPQPEENPELSPKALRHLPQEILDMLGSAVLPEGMARDGGSSDSLSPEEGDGKQISDGQMQALLAAIAPLAQGKDGMQKAMEPLDENPRSRLLKERMQAINERNLKRAAQKKRK
ncbi:hypothetical protein NB644_07565 [Oxalobacter formigenes]|uniref:hypothetical protein n=1 Tax=Oxalobacter formigenes TaxID=847 RepID=UPI0022AFFB35|nr:hypothetical protein [Oxalobacter formigenes]WAW00804.1 hypothetical protein NB644_07565 [Oxalobacter formigenes]WAW03135.1 hypothetical protein NB642_08350 [Oxalobacter formigenes]WAW06429.1 hypothetical protein NB639_03195 [Oxalobacter formigenes]